MNRFMNRVMRQHILRILRNLRTAIGLSLLTLGVAVPAAAQQQAALQAALPLVFLNTAEADTPANGAVLGVAAGGDLQAALNAANCGDRILLAAGATFTGNYVLPNKGDCAGNWIWVMTDGTVPLEGTRMTPSLAATLNLPKIITANRSLAAVRTALGANHYRLIGIEFGMAAGLSEPAGAGLRTTSIVQFGDSSEDTVAKLSHHLIVDRSYIHGNPAADVRRGITANANSVAVVDSYISDIHEVGADSQAIGLWSSEGPMKVVNNYLEAAGENFMPGGAQTIPNITTCDIEFRRNHAFKPLKWMKNHPEYAGIQWSVKNLFELKNACRVLVEGNVFENNWGGQGQSGDGILLKATPDQTAGARTEDVTIRYNILRDSGGGIRVGGKLDPLTGAQLVNRITIHDNLLENINAAAFNAILCCNTGKAFTLLNAPQDVQIEHNTAFPDKNAFFAGVTPGVDITNGFLFRNNIVGRGSFGFDGENSSEGNIAINDYLRPIEGVVRNVVMGAPCTKYPADTSCPASWDAVGFVNFAEGDYRLSDTSPYKGAGTDGKDLGADFGAMTTAMSAPAPPPPPAEEPPAEEGPTAEQRLTDLEARVAALEAAVLDLQSKVAALSTRLDAVEAKNAAQDLAIAEMRLALDVLRLQMDAIIAWLQLAPF